MTVDFCSKLVKLNLKGQFPGYYGDSKIWYEEELHNSEIEILFCESLDFVIPNTIKDGRTLECRGLKSVSFENPSLWNYCEKKWYDKSTGKPLEQNHEYNNEYWYYQIE